MKQERKQRFSAMYIRHEILCRKYNIPVMISVTMFECNHNDTHWILLTGSTCIQIVASTAWQKQYREEMSHVQILHINNMAIISYV
jgi:hypothetical protein